MPKISEIISETTFEADLNGVPVKVTFNPNFFTLGREDALSMLVASGDHRNADVCEVYTQLFTKMDLQDEDGVDYPMTAEGLLRIPTPILNSIIRQAREHIRGNLLVKSKTSDSG